MSVVRISIWFFMLFACISCGSTRLPVQKPKRDLTHVYNPGDSPIHPEFRVVHETDEISRLYIKLRPVELLFNQANEEGIFMARLDVHYDLVEIVEGMDNGVLVDSATVEYKIRMDEVKDVFVAHLSFRAGRPGIYQLKVWTFDRKRGKGAWGFVRVDKMDVFSDQNFMVRYPGSGQPVFTRVLDSATVVSVDHFSNTGDSVFIRKYTENHSLPSPPFYAQYGPRPVYRPDSIYVYPINDLKALSLPDEGIYHFQLDPGREEGLSLFNFGSDFPRVTTVTGMIGPMAYITSAREFNELKNAKNKKLTVDNFWIETTGDLNRARELIRVYYNRVFFANHYFSCAAPGWRTDRGMIYIIYGPPAKLEKNLRSEKWIYFRKKSSQPLIFTFRKTGNQFSDNHYLLVRGEASSANTLWQQAVQSWRKGKVFYPDQ